MQMLPSSTLFGLLLHSQHMFSDSLTCLQKEFFAGYGNGSAVVGGAAVHCERSCQTKETGKCT